MSPRVRHYSCNSPPRVAGVIGVGAEYQTALRRNERSLSLNNNNGLRSTDIDVRVSRNSLA